MAQQTQYISSTETAKLIRQNLKAAFPATKFSVRKGGNSVRVEWVDGPTTSDVDKVAKDFEGQTFDGMRDLAEVRHTTDAQGNDVVYCVHYVFTVRTLSPEFQKAIMTLLQIKWGFEMPTFSTQWNEYENLHFPCSESGLLTIGQIFRKEADARNGDIAAIEAEIAAYSQKHTEQAIAENAVVTGYVWEACDVDQIFEFGPVINMEMGEVVIHKTGFIGVVNSFNDDHVNVSAGLNFNHGELWDRINVRPSWTFRCSACGEIHPKSETRVIAGVHYCAVCGRRHDERESKLAAKNVKRAKGAQKARKEAQSLRKTNNEILGAMNGTPILIEHHSEKRHRKELDRVHRRDDKIIELGKKAERMERAIERSESNDAASTDDPTSIVALEQKRDTLQKQHAFMVAVNKLIFPLIKARKSDTEVIAAIRSAFPDVSESGARSIATAHHSDPLKRIGFAPYQLTNSGARIRAISAQIDEMRSKATKVTQAVNAGTETTREEHARGLVVERDLLANRIRLIFPERLSQELFKFVRSCGFVYSPTNRAFQRQLNAAGEYAATRVIARWEAI